MKCPECGKVLKKSAKSGRLNCVRCRLVVRVTGLLTPNEGRFLSGKHTFLTVNHQPDQIVFTASQVKIKARNGVEEWRMIGSPVQSVRIL